MGHKLWRSLLAFGLSFTAAGCLVSGFGLWASMEAVGLFCLMGAVFGIFLDKRPLWLFIPAAVVCLGLALFGSLVSSFEALVSRLLSPESPILGSCTQAVMVLGMFSSWLVTWSTARDKPIYPALGLLPWLLVCLPNPQTTPDSFWLFGFLGLFTLLLLTHSLCRRVPEQGNRLIRIAVIPVLCLTLGLYAAFPREGYQMDRLSLSLMEQVRSWFLPQTPEGPSGKPLKVNGGAVSLSSLGDRKESSRVVLTVTSNVGGAMYLRSCSYDTYYDNNWTNLAVPNALDWPDSHLLEATGQVQIQTNGYFDMILTPYYPMDDTLYGVSRGITNFTDKRSYQYTFGQLTDRPETVLPEDLNAYTQLPAQTRAWAAALLEDVLLHSRSVSQKANAIARYLSQAAEYTLTPGTMPPTDTDFVRWFLEDNKQGYCIHFASAGVILLRAAGIPARYTTGFLFTAQENTPTEVTGNHAHAWAEYWLPGVGWVVLETTPASAVSQQLAPPAQEVPPTGPEETPKENSDFSIPLPPLWLVLTLLGAGCLALLLQWPVRVMAKNRRCRKGSCNDQLLCWWQRLNTITDRLDQAPEEPLRQLAEKAAFSPHAMTPEEVGQMQQAYRSAVSRLRKKPLYRRLCYRLVWALY